MNNTSAVVMDKFAVQRSQHTDQSIAKLLEAAHEIKATTIDQAQGTCLAMSLELCLLAQRLQVPAELVMWTVKNDPVFCDHWAVRVNQSQVIDLTRIQVDRQLSPNVLFDISDYPGNYQACRTYRTGPILEAYTLCKDAMGVQLPPVLIKKIRALMLRQDVRNVFYLEDLPGAASALLSYFKFRVFFYLGQLEGRLLMRRDGIEKRLHEQPNDWCVNQMIS